MEKVTEILMQKPNTSFSLFTQRDQKPLLDRRDEKEESHIDQDGLQYEDDCEVNDGEKKAVRNQWRPEEDLLILALYHKYGPHSWKAVQTEVNRRLGVNRSSKQCKDRWLNNLNPEVVNSNFTLNEDLRLARAHRVIGYSWTDLAKLLPGHSDNNVKNHFYSMLRSVVRRVARSYFS